MRLGARVVGTVLVCVVLSAIALSSAAAQTCGPMDIVFLVDDTGSMDGAITSVKTGLNSIVNTALTASGGSLQLGLITFKNDVTVRNELTTNIAAVTASINALVAGGGGNAPEASDEAKNTAVNNLPGGNRPDCFGFVGTQNGNFTTPYRAGALKIAIMITDNLPGGFDDISEPADQACMHTHALTAKANNILMSDIFVPDSSADPAMIPLMQDDAATSGGVFTQVAADGSGTDTAINSIIAACGGGGGGGTPVPTLSGWGLILMVLILVVVGVGRGRRHTVTMS
jgi:hypothetical protein